MLRNLRTMAIELSNLFDYRNEKARGVLVVGHYAETSSELLLDLFAVEIREHGLLDMRVKIGRHICIVLVLVEITGFTSLRHRVDLSLVLQVKEAPVGKARLELKTGQSCLE